jgi:hypothetical protein
MQCPKNNILNFEDVIDTQKNEFCSTVQCTNLYYILKNHMSRGDIFFDFLYIMLFYNAMSQKKILTVEDVKDIQRNAFCSTVQCSNLYHIWKIPTNHLCHNPKKSS